MSSVRKYIAYTLLIGAVLLFSIASIVSFVELQKKQNEIGIQRNGVVWLTSNLEIEYQRLLTAFEQYISPQPLVGKDELLLRFDIFWSRVPLLIESEEAGPLRGLPMLAQTHDFILAGLNRIETLLEGFTPDDQATVAKIRAELAELNKPIHQLGVDAYLIRARSNDFGHEQTLESHRFLYGSFVGILLSSLALVFLLLVQLRRGNQLLKTTHQALDTAEKQTQALQTEVQQRQRIEKALSQEKERAQVTLESIGDGVITTDTKGKVLYLNPIAEQLTGYEVAGAKGEPVSNVFNIVDEHSGESKRDPVDACLQENRIISHADNTVLISRDGREFSVENTAAPIRNHQDQIDGVVLVFRDVSKARHLTKQLSYQAQHDALTGLVNRNEFEKRIEQALASARGDNEQHAVLYLDLDQFKVVNDTCGHAAGDELLRQLSMHLSTRLRKSDTLARLGGDEFGVLLVGCPAPRAKILANQIRQAVEEYRFHWDQRTFRVGVSIGMVVVDADIPDIASILSAADIACYAAKDGGRNRVHVYEADDQQLVERHGEMQWISRITQAIEENHLRLYCQRIAPVAASAGTIPCYEILLRMVDADDGRLIPPMAFIPAAERYNLMARVDRWVVENTFAWLAANPRFAAYYFTINLSGQTFGDERFLEWLVMQLEAGPIIPSNICFEITETAAISNLNDALAFIARLRALGCLFSMDDFGSGLSSFNYLKTLPVDHIKIDGAFVKDLLTDPLDAAMVESTIQIGHTMGLKTIAEYVENDAVLQQLKIMGVDYAQGYGIAKPKPLDALLFDESDDVDVA